MNYGSYFPRKVQLLHCTATNRRIGERLKRYRLARVFNVLPTRIHTNQSLAVHAELGGDAQAVGQNGP